ncbi:MAG TPA: GxxExxY protein [Candidatus Acidoferrum sp.]|nr:GxxExxY protein [Candidatus Acidoferrum sp.]
MQLEPPRHQGAKRPEISAELNAVVRAVVDGAFRVHSQLGPGLLESVYETCLVHELHKRGLHVERQLALPVLYDGLKVDAGLRLDLLVEGEIVVELKAAEVHHPVYEAQLLTYLKLSSKRLGFLINFNVPKIRDGIKRMIL